MARSKQIMSRSTRHPPALAPASSSNRPSVYLTRPSTDEPRNAPRDTDFTRLRAVPVPSSDDSGDDSDEDSEAEEVEVERLNSLRDHKRHQVNEESEILDLLKDLGIPWDDARRKKSKSKKTTLTARYKQTPRLLSSITYL